MAEFGTPETWNMKVGDFIETELPKEKPQALLDLQEQNRKSRVLDALNKIGPGLMDESLDFIKRENFSTAGLAKTLLKKIQPYAGADKIGLPTKKLDRTPEKNFMKAFIDFMNKKHGGNFSAAARAIGEDRNKIKGIFDRVRLSETGTRAGADVGKGGKLQTTIPEPKKKTLYKDATTAVKADQKFFKDKIKNYNKTKYYNAKDLGNILELDFPDKGVLDKFTNDLKRFNVKSKSATGVEGGKKTYQLGDVVDKLTVGYKKKLVEGQRLSQSERAAIDAKLDPDLKSFLGNFRQTTRNISKEEDIYVPNAIEDVGHPLSVKITDKYPKLTKNSNINKINTLTFQDPIVNQKILEATGYESKHDVLLKKLDKLVGKKIGPEEIKELQEIKNTMNALHSKAVEDVKNLAKEGTSLYNPRTKKTTTYKSKYFKGQENRIPKIDINIPKQGQIFKSEDLFVDMSNVNPAFKVGLVEEINPNARFFKDLTKEQKEIYKRNVLDQTKFNLDKFYTKAGFPKEQVDELKDSLEFGTASKLGIGTVGTLGLGSTAAAADEGDGNFISTKDVDGNLVAMELPRTDAETLDEFAEKEQKGSLLGDIGAGAGLTTGAVLGSKATQADPLKGLRRFGKKGAMNLLKILGTPAGVAAYEAGLIPGLEGGVADRLKEGDSAEDVFLRSPSTYAGLPLATLGQEFLKTRPALQRLLNLGLSPKVVRMGTPVGIGLMGLTGLYDAAKTYQEEFEAMSPEQQKEYLKEQEEFGEDIQGAAEGGRIGFADGPKDPSKRTFMKIMAGIASLPVVGKFFKAGKPVVEKLVNTPTVMPDWFPNFVQKFMNNSIGKKIDADLIEYENPDLPEVKLTRSDDGRVFVEGRNEYDQPYEIQYEPPGYELVDPKTGQAVRTPGNFEAVEGRHVAVGPEDYDVEAYYPTDLDEIAAGDIRAMEKYATGKISGTVKDAMGKDTGLKKGEYDLNMAEGRAESAADIARDLDD